MTNRLLLSALAALALLGPADARSSAPAAQQPSTAPETPTHHSTQRGLLPLPSMFPRGWSNPSVSSRYGVQFRRRFDVDGPFDTTPDVILRFEPLPQATVDGLRQQYPNLVVQALPITSAMVVRDVKTIAGERIHFFAERTPDGAWEVRVPAPPGGWLDQTIDVRILAASGRTVVIDRSSRFTLSRP